MPRPKPWKPPKLPCWPRSEGERGAMKKGAADAPFSSSVDAFLALNELDLVAVRVFDESNDCLPMLHGAGFACNFAAARLDVVTGLVGVFHFDRDVAVAVTEVVAGRVPVVGQFDHRAVGFVLVADEGQGEFAVGVVLAAQQAHAQDLGVEGQRLLEIPYAQHGVQNTHSILLCKMTG